LGTEVSGFKFDNLTILDSVFLLKLATIKPNYAELTDFSSSLAHYLCVIIGVRLG
jgi:hypothetical protein